MDDTAVTTLSGRAFFEYQQERRREAQARLTGQSLPIRPTPPPTVSPAVSPTSVTQVISSVPAEPAAPAVQLLVTNGANEGQVFALHPGELIIGRENGSAILLDDLRISHNHALLRVSGDTVTIEDLRSTNGTRVNGESIKSQTPISPRDQIDLGGVHLVIEPCPTTDRRSNG
jgi:pSer/pThr/pTyr-binding forkhead associated (FHA) protein